MEGGGEGEASVAGPLKEITLFAASLIKDDFWGSLPDFISADIFFTGSFWLRGRIRIRNP